jgi:hypothetical protein
MDNYTIYQVVLTEMPTGKEKQICLTNSKEKAKLMGMKQMCENYSFIMASLRKVDVIEYSIQTDSFTEYWMSQLIDHRDIELQCLKLLHNAKCQDRVQNKYVIFSSNTLLKI